MTYKLITMVIMLIGLICLFNISPVSLFYDFEKFYNYSKEKREKNLENKKISLKKQADIIAGKKKTGFIARNFNDVSDLLKYRLVNTSMIKIYFISTLLAIVGIIISIAVKNVFLIPVLAVGFALLPVWIIKLREASYKKQINAMLETALSGITTSYMRNNNIILAVEENMKHINYPLHSIFSKFVNENKLLDANIAAGIRNMKNQLDNPTFKEWCDAMIQCQSDHSLKITLFPIVNKFSEMKNIQAELDTIMMIPFQQFITMSVILASGLPVMWFINKDWFNILVTTIPGKFIIALSVVSLFASLNKAVSLCKPVEYKR